MNTTIQSLKRLILPALALWLLISGCSGRMNSPEKVVAVSIPPQKFLLEQLCGNKYQVLQFLPAGANHESYEPTPQDIAMLTRASLYFSEGHLDFEKNWLPRFIGKGNTRLVNTSEGITLITGHHHDHGHHETGADPHVWLSAQCVKKQVENIADVLMEQDSSNASYYDANRQKLLHIIDSVDQTIQGILSDHRGKSFLIFHPALGYFARDYGLEQVSIEEEGKEPTAARIAELIDLCRKKGIKSIFIQKEFDARNAEAIAKEVNARLIVIDPMAYNWPVNMIGLAKTIAEN